METKFIMVKDIVNSDQAIADFQAYDLRKEINYGQVVSLDFKGVETASTAFLNIVLSGFIGFIKEAKELSVKLKIKNWNDIIKYAYEDAYELLEEKLVEKNGKSV